MREEIAPKIIKIFEDKVIPLDVNEDSHFINDLVLDSLDQVEVIMDIENAFKICIHDSEFDQLSTVKQTIDLVIEKLKPKDDILQESP